MFLEMSLNLYFRTVIILVINPAGFITTVLSDICLIKRQKIHFLKDFIWEALKVFSQQYLGQGVVQYSIDVNFTLTIMPQRASYYHHTFITARVFNTCEYIYSSAPLKS